MSSLEVVPGDLVLLEDGARVPADVRLLETRDLECEEAALTGESVPVVKEAHVEPPNETALAERRNMAFMGTRVSRGRGRGLISNTGVYTELGKIAGMLARVAPEQTPLEEDLERFGKRVVLGCIAVSAIVFGAGLMMGRSSVRELFLVAVALAVAAIPEGLPAVTTIVLALGTQRMARRNALVRRLPAVETLGCTQVICTDKTGTLTQNAMTARRLFADGKSFEVEGDPRRLDGALRPTDGADTVPVDLEMVLDCASQAPGAHVSVYADGTEVGRVEVQGDPTDGALLVMSRRAGWESRAEVRGEQPFTSARKMASVLVQVDGQTRSYVRGAPEVLLGRSTQVWKEGLAIPLDADARKQLTDEAATWAARSMRVIALAFRQGHETPIGPCVPIPAWEEELTFLALVGIVDPAAPPEVAERPLQEAPRRHPHHDDHFGEPSGDGARHRRGDRPVARR